MQWIMGVGLIGYQVWVYVVINQFWQDICCICVQGDGYGFFFVGVVCNVGQCVIQCGGLFIYVVSMQMKIDMVLLVFNCQ